MFISILSVAVAYQFHLISLADKLNNFTETATSQIASKDFENAKATIDDLKKLWNKNSSFLMMFHDHSLINNSSVNISLASSAVEKCHYDDAVSHLIYFIAVIDELVAENRPTFENIL